MSVDRYLAIVHTMRRSMTPSTTKRCIAASWVISSIPAAAYLYKMDTKNYKDSYVCKSSWSSDREQHLFYSAVEECTKFALYYALPLIAIGYTNAIIGYNLRKRQPIGFSQTEARINKQNQKIFMLLVSIVALFAFCWIFAHVNHLLSVFQPATYCKLPAGVPLFFFWFSHVNSAINPIIYFIFNNKFRQGLSKALRWKDKKSQTRDAIIPQENCAFDDMDLERHPSNIKEEQVNTNQTGVAVILQNDMELENIVHKAKDQQINNKQTRTAMIPQENLAFVDIEFELDGTNVKKEQGNNNQTKIAIIHQESFTSHQMELETDSSIEKEEQFEFDSYL